MRCVFSVFCVAFFCLGSGVQAQTLTAVEISEQMDGSVFTFEPTRMAEWYGVWAFDLKNRRSKVSSMPKGGDATYKTVLNGNQLCNVGGVPNLHAAHGLSGCFTVLRKRKSLYLYKGKRRVFSLRSKGKIR